MLDKIAAKLLEKGLITTQWESDVQTQGELVKLYREYYDGFHRIQLTPEMKKMIGINDNRLDRYNANYCEMVVGTMADRLTVEQFDVIGDKGQQAPLKPSYSETPAPMPTSAIVPQRPTPAAPLGAAPWVDPAQTWVKELMDSNRFDALQIAIREAVLRDGETFIMSQYDDDLGRVRLAHELAYDGEVGTIVIYQRGYEQIAAAVKIWFDVPPTPAETLVGETGDTTYMRVNIYYPGYTEKYYSKDGKDIHALTNGPEETIREGKSPGVPLVCFKNKGGVSELVNIIPLQDTLNSFVIDLVMAGRLTAFSVFFAKGINMPQGITPGMTISKNIVDSNGAILLPQSPDEARAQADILNAADLKRIEGGDLKQILDSINMVVNQIAVIASTPIPNQTSGTVTASGEALIQRDRRLQGKLERAQVQIGNRWEDVVLLANMQQRLFGATKPPAITSINTRWKSSELRNPADVLLAAKQLNDWGFTRQALKTLSQTNLVSFTDQEIDEMMKDKAKDMRNWLMDTISQNAMGSLNVPSSQSLNFNPAPAAGG